MRCDHHRRLALESLEDRSMLAVGILDNGWVGVLGTKNRDHIRIADSGGGHVTVVENGYTAWRGYAPAVAILGLAGNDYVEVDGTLTITVLVDGGKGDDEIHLGSGDDVAIGGKGNDMIWGGAGNDWVIGEGGHDRLFGGDGIDVVSGGGGNDLIYGDGDGDFLSGDGGHDKIYAGLGDDLVDGGAGKDLIEGGEGVDELMGLAGVDWIYGGDGDDLIDGGAGNDLCSGGIGDDRLKGGAGRDQLDGDTGHNILDPDKGKDLLFNGIQADLDLDSSVTFSYPNGGSGSAKYQFVNQSGVLIARFHVEVQNCPPLSNLNVYVNNMNVGQIVTDASGNGTLELSTAPSGNELPFPVGFAGIHPGMSIAIDGGVPVTLIGAYFVERPLALPPLPF